MRCSQAQRLISDHIDNLLDGKQVEKLENHLQKCSRCRDLLAEIEAVVNKAKHLETIPPPEDLWPSIKKQIVKKEKKAVIKAWGKRLSFGLFQYPVRLSFVASILIAAIILASFYYYEFPFIRSEKDSPEMIALHHFREAEKHYRSAIDALNQAISDQHAKLSPELSAVFKKNLEIIDDSIQACQVAIAEHPKNQEANDYLMLCYRKKIELLNEIKSLIMQSG